VVEGAADATADVADVADVPLVAEVPVEDLDPHPAMTSAKTDATTKITKETDLDRRRRRGRWKICFCGFRPFMVAFAELIQPVVMSSWPLPSSYGIAGRPENWWPLIRFPGLGERKPAPWLAKERQDRPVGGYCRSSKFTDRTGRNLARARNAGTDFC
jgi:hypothetical protein